jgi:hypothetical protein
MKVVHGMKPKDIAKALKVSVYDVYKADRRVKGNYRKAVAAAAEAG